MRVICIESSWCDDKRAITVHKDSIYNVTNIIKGNYWLVDNNGRYISNVWYELLETGKYTHSATIFREIDDISEEKEEEIKVEQLTK